MSDPSVSETKKSESSVDERRLFSLAYGVLGVVSDAQDVVQDAHLRLLQQPQAPTEAGPWLFRVVTNLAIDRLRHEQVRRLEYIGPWLPDPVLADELVELSEALSIGLLTVLETLKPVDRAVYVLRGAFDLSFEEIGDVTESSSSTARQRFHRAQQKISLADHRPTVPATQQVLIQQLMLAVASGDRDVLLSLLTDDSKIYSDGGGVVRAALIPVTGPERIVQMTLFLAKKYPANEVQIRFLEMPGAMGMLWQHSSEPATLTIMEGALRNGETGQLHRAYIQRNPDKMQPFLERVGGRLAMDRS